MTLAAIIFLLTLAILLLVTLPFVLMAWEIDEFKQNLKFWSIVAAAVATPWVVMEYIK